MKTIVKYLVVSGIIILFTKTLSAQWVPLNPPWTSNIATITSNKDLVFAGGQDIFVSSDKGVTWSMINKPIDYYLKNVISLAASDSFLFALVPDGLVSTCLYRSVINSNEWEIINLNNDNVSNVTSIVVEKGNIFVWAYPYVLRSTDNGYTWSQTDSSTLPYISTFAISSNKKIRSLVLFDRFVFGITETDGVLRSDTNHVNWIQMSNGLPHDTQFYLGSLACAGGVLFVSTYAGFYRSNDTGNSWIPIDVLPNTSGLVFSAHDVVFASSSNYHYDGFYYSKDYGATWISTSCGLTERTIQCLSLIDSTLFAGIYYGLTGSIFRSTDHGRSWNSVFQNTYSQRICTFLKSGNAILSGGWDGLFRSIDSGKTWVTVGNFSTYCLANAENRIIAGTDEGLRTSIDNGITWNYSIPNPSSGTVISLMVFNDTIIAGTSGAGIFRSIDSGTSWNKVETSPWGVSTFLQHGNIIYAGSAVMGVYCSNNRGSSFYQFNKGLEVLDIRSLCEYDSGIIAGASNSIFRLRDGSESWEQISMGYPSNASYGSISLVIDNDMIFAGTFGGGIWKVNKNDVIPNPTAIKRKPHEQRFRTSFIRQTSVGINNKLIVELSLAHDEHAKISLFNLSGKLVSSLMEGSMIAGEHKISFALRNIPIGLYVIRFKIGNNVHSDRIVISR